MALGGNYQNQNNGQTYEPSYYSRLKIKNYQDNTGLSFTFWKGTLKVAIVDTSGKDGKVNELAFIHLSPSKAMMMAESVDRVIKDETDENSYGVDTGVKDTRGFISVGREQGVPYLFIAKVNNEGKYESSKRFIFNTNTNCLYKVHDLANLKLTKEYQNNIDLIALKNLFEDYARSANGAFGASFYDIGRYESNKLTNLVRKIADKVGVANGGSNGGGSGRSYFDGASSNSGNNFSSNNNSGTNRRMQTVDDIEDELE